MKNDKIKRIEEDGEEVNELDDLKLQIEEFENKYKRALADYQNLQKRVDEEKREWIRAANRELLLRLMPILDILILAQKHAQDEGIKVSVAHFLDTLKGEGVTKIKTEGEEFDPMLMEVVTTGNGEDGKVIEEIRAGYLLYDKLLRPAQVKVGKADNAKH